MLLEKFAALGEHVSNQLELVSKKINRAKSIYSGQVLYCLSLKDCYNVFVKGFKLNGKLQHM